MALFTGEQVPSPNITGTKATSATGGSASSLPAAPVGYITVQINGTLAKIPYYAI